MKNIVRSRAFELNLPKFQAVLFDRNGIPSIPDFLFPELTREDLKLISLGTYHINNAVSYYAHHIRDNDNEFLIFICPNDIRDQFVKKLNIDNISSNLNLILAQIDSRFKAGVCHNTVVLYDVTLEGSDSIIGYYCFCQVGSRTVGCCSHSMMIIWYLGYARIQPKITEPAKYLDNFFPSQNINYELDDDL